MIEPRPMKLPRSPLASLPGWDIAERIVAEQHNQRVLQRFRACQEWSDPADLALAVAEEMQRGRG